MNFIDIFVISIIGIFALLGFMKGFVSQLFQAVGIFCAFWFNTPLSKFLAEKFSDEPEGTVLLLSGIAAFFIIFFVFLIAGWLIGKTVNFALTSIPNRIAGILFGAVKGFLIVTIIFLVIRSFSADGSSFLDKYIIPDKTTDDLINKSLELASKASDGEISVKFDSLKNASENIDYEENSRTYSRIGYAAYRVSKMMDPFVQNIRSMAEDKIDEVIEEKVIKKIDEIKEKQQ
ncbi:MAG: CvpA family protein [Candidatus Delongbacteria bacterium]|jgi:membrane protein required for colicin V production|nr:CvpA family protein [Candidatus Delongbacteria bacterium]